MQYNVQNAPLQPLVITMSYNQMQQYNEQLQLFRRVYEFNSNDTLKSLQALELTGWSVVGGLFIETEIHVDRVG